MKKKTIRDIDLQGKRVLLRVDYNVQVENGRIVDDTRLRESLPTIHELRKAGACVIVCSHRGRPRGGIDESLRNAPVALHLTEMLGVPVRTTQDCIGPEAEAQAAALRPGDVLMLENVRFHPEEEANNDEFARALARVGDVFVNDAFGTAHRAHASTVGVTKYLPSVAGLLLEREVDYLTKVTDSPERPFGIVLGGSKVSDKIAILENLTRCADVICIGGAIANTFLKARGIDVADSLVENDGLAGARYIMALAEHRGDIEIVLPSDVVVAFGGAEGALVRTVSVAQVPVNWRILDVGPGTVQSFASALQRCKTVVWNGPMGLFEREPFDRGSMAVARVLGELRSATTVVGGGETVAALRRAHVAERISHVSTGGGASLAMLQGKPLPAVDALLDA
ncbi:MAG: phosphoglycerate kinase [Dehalococcoidia bacterium]